MFELIPAIDLKGGKCVRLREGDAASATEYGDDPVAMALRWQEQGAARLHVVDLDGAFAGDARHVGACPVPLRRAAHPGPVRGRIADAANRSSVSWTWARTASSSGRWPSNSPKSSRRQSAGTARPSWSASTRAAAESRCGAGSSSRPERAGTGAAHGRHRGGAHHLHRHRPGRHADRGQCRGN